MKTVFPMALAFAILCAASTLSAQTLEAEASASTPAIGGAGTDAPFAGDAFERQPLGLTPAPETQRARPAPGVWAIFKMLLFVALIIALIYALAYFLKFVSGSQRLFQAHSAARVLHVLPLTGKHSVYTVKLGARLLVLGVSPDGVRRLAEVTDPDETLTLTRDLAVSTPASSPFARLLRSKTAWTSGEGGASEADRGDDGGDSELRDRSVYTRARGELEGIRRTIDRWRTGGAGSADEEDRP